MNQTNEVDKLCFTTCACPATLPGAAGLIRSIRKFYGPEDADIVVFVEERSADFRRFCDGYSVDLHYFDEINGWVQPLVYGDTGYSENRLHYYHPHFEPHPDVPYHVNPTPGFGSIHHLHSYNVRAYCAGYCLCVKEYARVVYLDADAFLISAVDDIFPADIPPGTIIGFGEGEDSLDNLSSLYGVEKTDGLIPSAYAFDACVVFYANSPTVQRLARDHMFYVESCYHYDKSSSHSGQGILRALVAKYDREGAVQFHRADILDLDPTRTADDGILYDQDRGEWIRTSTGKRISVLHKPDGDRLWTRCSFDPMNAAWRWAGGGYEGDWMLAANKDGSAAQPVWQAVVQNDRYVDKLCFTTCLNAQFMLGTVGLIRSIRKYYRADEADIVVFVSEEVDGLAQFCAEHDAELHRASELNDWVQPLIYMDPTYAENTLHYYHPHFQPSPEIPYHASSNPGFGTLHHLHPLNLKAYCTGYCICVRNYRHVVHVDSDAFLLNRVDEIFDRYPASDAVIGFEDGEDSLPGLESLYQVMKPYDFAPSDFAFNGGIVFYTNGAGVKELVREFMFCIESCYHFDRSAHFSDQGVLRCVVAKHAILGRVEFHRVPRMNWNPLWHDADELEFDVRSERWINLKNNETQYIWHGSGASRLWLAAYPSPSVNLAWRSIGGPYAAEWPEPKLPVRFDSEPMAIQFSSEPNAKLCFAACSNRDYQLGAMGLIRSIRKFYSREEADIVVFVDSDFGDFKQFCIDHAVEMHYVRDIDNWVQPLIYHDPTYANDTRHTYHPDFKPSPILSYSKPSTSGFGRLRHLTPLHVKAYATGYCLCVKNSTHVVYLDADAFLLAPIDDMFTKYGERDSVIAFDDTNDDLLALEPLFGVRKPSEVPPIRFGFNAGVVFYVNGPGVKKLSRDCMFYTESRYHYDCAPTYGDGDQGLLRCLVAKHHLLGNIQFYLEDAVNWNPTWKRAEQLTFDSAANCWINESNGQRQRIWHDAVRGGWLRGRIWTGRQSSASVNAAWKWIGGTYETWRTVPGSPSAPACEAIAAIVSDFQSPGSSLKCLYIGNQYGRAAIALTTILREKGFEIDACVWESFNIDRDSETFRSPISTLDNAKRFGIADNFLFHMALRQDSILQHFAGKRFDFIYIHAAPDYRQMHATCVAAIKLSSERSIIAGDDFNRDDVRRALLDVFGETEIRSERNQWIITMSDTAPSLLHKPMALLRNA